jgi:S1-C subfamily serine protease
MTERAIHAPRQEDFGFDLSRTFMSVVSVRSQIPEDAYTASLLGTERGGNGVVIRDDGVILTIGYLITEAETIWITDHAGRATPGHVLGYDQETGFGLVQSLHKLDLPALTLGSSATVKEGDPVLMAGFGGTKGSVSARVIAVREFSGYWEYLLDEAIFTAPAHPNWGGTGLIGRNGELLGIGSLFIQQGTAGQQAIDGNMVVPIDLLKPILEDLLTVGRQNKKPRPWLGLFGTEVDDRVVVAALSRGGPADQAGVHVGDILLAVSRRQVTSLAEFFRAFWGLGAAGVVVPITVARDGEMMEIEIQSIARSDVLKRPKLH